METTLEIPVDKVHLKGDLVIPENAAGLVIFAHGSGSSRLSSRNRFVARELEKKGFATLLFDLLTVEEDETYENRFDIDRLTRRLVAVTQWILKKPECRALATGYFGASTGAASALAAAAQPGNTIKAVVSRGGRPDLAMPVLHKVKAPTLLIVGSLDAEVIELNEQAYAAITAPKEIRLITGATHLFEEPGTLEEVAKLAGAWFERYLLQINDYTVL
jgi:putative phosphoribosyl transferase